MIQELQSLLKPFDGELDVYPVSKEVGKVGNNSPSFIIPVDSKENKHNIANFFARGTTTSPKKAKQPAPKEEKAEPPGGARQPDIKIKQDEGFVAAEDERAEDDGDESKQESRTVPTHKRKAGNEDDATRASSPPPPPVKKTAVASPPSHSSPAKAGKVGEKPKTISSTSNSNSKSRGGKSQSKGKKPDQSQGQQRKITGFFANSS